VVINYYLQEKPTEPATLEIIDSSGQVVRNFTSVIPEKKEDREGVYVPLTPGMNRFIWDAHHEPGEKVKGSEAHSRPPGPLALPGEYQVRLTIGDWSQAQSFKLLLDPRVNATIPELQTQLDAQLAIRNKLNEMIKAVNKVRDITAQLNGYAERLKDHAEGAKVKEHATKVKERLAEIEKSLIAVDFRPGDALNIELKLIEKIDMLTPVVGSADAAPTRQVITVYNKLAAEADGHLGNLAEVLDTDVAGFNALLATLTVPQVIS
jgi:hypothetical protein